MLLTPAPGLAQTLVGQILEEGREDRPVPEAAVALVDREGNRHAEVMADSLGRYRAVPPEAGEYTVVIARIGYVTTRSPLFAMGTEGTASLDFLLQPDPLSVEGLEVEVESVDEVAERLLRPFGLSAELLDERYIDRDEIDAMTMPGGVANVILWQGIPGVSIRQELGRPATPDSIGASTGSQLCVTQVRGRPAGASYRCAIVVLDGVRITRESGAIIDTRDVEAIAVLGPVEATTFYGTDGGGGAVLIWTRQGRPRVR